MKRVLMSDELFDQLGASRVDWGEPDRDGFYTPTVYRDEGRLREWLDKREAVPWSRGFSDEFKRGYEAAFEEFRAALAATPEPQ